MTLSSRFRRFLKAIAGKDTIPDPESPVEVLLGDIAKRINSIAYRSGGGSGESGYYVDFTRHNYDNSWTANRSFDEIKAAYNAEQQIYFRFSQKSVAVASHAAASQSQPERFYVSFVLLYLGSYNGLISIDAKIQDGSGVSVTESAVVPGKQPLTLYIDNFASTDATQWAYIDTSRTKYGAYDSARRALENASSIMIKQIGSSYTSGISTYFVNNYYIYRKNEFKQRITISLRYGDQTKTYYIWDYDMT